MGYYIKRQDYLENSLLDRWSSLVWWYFKEKTYVNKGTADAKLSTPMVKMVVGQVLQ